MILVGCGPALNKLKLYTPCTNSRLQTRLPPWRSPTLERCERRLHSLVFDPATVPSALPLIQLTLYGLPETRDRYERRMREIMSMEALQRYDVTRHLHAISVPTLVIWGRHDMRGNLAEAEQSAGRLANGKMIILEECGHLPYLKSRESLMR